MNRSLRLLAIASLLLSSLSATSLHAATSDPSGRVARLSDISGEVSYSPAGEDQWYATSRNRPLTRGDRLWTDRNGRAELQFGSAALRLGADTSFEILDLNDRLGQVQVTQGTIGISVRRLYRGQSIEVATPTLAFVIDRVGRYRIDVDPDGLLTTIVVWEGSGEAWGEGSNFSLRAGDAVSFYASDLRDHQMYALPQGDRFDRYCLSRDQRLNQSASLRYVDDDLVGYAELDEYGTWSSTRDYGNVWYPTQVAANWAPYRDGHWVWQDPWGWTWVDDAPWGFAPSHYGRWVSVSGRWGWLPGPRNVRPVYAPALVAFVGGSDWGLSINVSGGSRSGGSRIGWFPLGPRDVYMPSYRTSREYFTQVNVSNTVVNNTTITTVYNNYTSGNINVAQDNYAYRSMVTAVPGDVFRNSQPVSGAVINVDQQMLAQTEIMNLAPLAPSALSIAGSAADARVKPSAEAFDRNVYARNAPPPEQQPFAARQERLQRNPGMSIERDAKPSGNENQQAREHVRVITAGADAADARAAGSSRDGDVPNDGKPLQLQPLDRAAENDRPKDPARQAEAQQQAQQQREDAAGADQAQQTRQAEQAARRAEQADQRQAAEQQRQVDPQQQQQQQQQRRDDAANAERAEQVRQAQQAREAEQATQRQAAEQQQRDVTQQAEQQQQQELQRQQQEQGQQQQQREQQLQREQQQQEQQQQREQQQREQQQREQQQQEQQQQQQQQREQQQQEQQLQQQQREQQQQEQQQQQQQQREQQQQQQREQQQQQEQQQQREQQQQQEQRNAEQAAARDAAQQDHEAPLQNPNPSQQPLDQGQGRGKPSKENRDGPATDDDELDADGNPKPKKKRDE